MQLLSSTDVCNQSLVLRSIHYVNICLCAVGLILNMVVIKVWSSDFAFMPTVFLFKVIATFDLITLFTFLAKTTVASNSDFFEILVQRLMYSSMLSAIYSILLLAAVRLVLVSCNVDVHDRLLTRRNLGHAAWVIISLLTTEEFVLKSVAMKCLDEDTAPQFQRVTGMIMLAPVLVEMVLMVVVIHKANKSLFTAPYPVELMTNTTTSVYPSNKRSSCNESNSERQLASCRDPTPVASVLAIQELDETSASDASGDHASRNAVCREENPSKENLRSICREQHTPAKENLNSIRSGQNTSPKRSWTLRFVDEKLRKVGRFRKTNKVATVQSKNSCSGLNAEPDFKHLVQSSTSKRKTSISLRKTSSNERNISDRKTSASERKTSGVERKASTIDPRASASDQGKPRAVTSSRESLLQPGSDQKLTLNNLKRRQSMLSKAHKLEYTVLLMCLTTFIAFPGMAILRIVFTSVSGLDEYYPVVLHLSSTAFLLHTISTFLFYVLFVHKFRYLLKNELSYFRWRVWRSLRWNCLDPDMSLATLTSTIPIKSPSKPSRSPTNLYSHCKSHHGTSSHSHLVKASRTSQVTTRELQSQDWYLGQQSVGTVK